MFRIASILAVAALALVFQAQVGTAQPKGLDPTKPFEGELGGKQKKVSYQIEGSFSKKGSSSTTESVYTSSIPITLKAGQPLILNTTVTGEDRLVGIQVFDPTGKQIGPATAIAAKKTSTLTIKEVSANGKYTIVVFSDQIGPFTLQAASSEEELGGKLTKKELEDKIVRLKKELADADAALKALEKK